MQPKAFFVYGTLMRGEPNFEHHFGKRKIVEEYSAEVSGFEMYSMGSFPCCIATESNASLPPVKGRVIVVDDEDFEATLRAVDRLEGHPDFYRRIVVVPSHVSATKEPPPCWMYVLNAPGKVANLPRVWTNDWKKYLSNQPTVGAH